MKLLFKKNKKKKLNNKKFRIQLKNKKIAL